MPSSEPEWDESLAGIAAPGDVVADKYRLDALVGSGGMGAVVEAYHLSFEERVAIKFLLPGTGATEAAIERFEREARAAFKIKSEHVARVMDVGKRDRVPYMVMEYLQGRDLGALLVDREPMDLETAVTYVLQATDAVAEAHALGIVHRDLKPENLFLTHRVDGSPCIKVLDFGLSKVHEGAGTPSRQRAVTATSQSIGTPHYMSPEQWMSASDVGPAADQWGLAVILYELLTGRRPFEGETLAQLCTQVLRGEPTPPSAHGREVPREVGAVLSRALRKEPEQRYPNLAAFAIDLAPFSPRMRPTVKRIKGILEEAGADVGTVPSSPRVPRGDGLPRPSTVPEAYEQTDMMEIGAPGAVSEDDPTALHAVPQVDDARTHDDEAPTRVRPAPTSDVTEVLPVPDSAPDAVEGGAVDRYAPPSGGFGAGPPPRPPQSEGSPPSSARPSAPSGSGLPAPPPSAPAGHRPPLGSSPAIPPPGDALPGAAPSVPTGDEARTSTTEIALAAAAARKRTVLVVAAVLGCLLALVIVIASVAGASSDEGGVDQPVEKP